MRFPNLAPRVGRPTRAARLALVLAATVGLTGIAAGPAASTTAAANFPAADSDYHSYAEMVAEIQATETAHPDIVQLSVIGQSYQGRDIWVAKISDNVATDETEPEVMFDGVHHAREHLSLEQTLAILRWLATGYGTDSRVTSMVDTREIWIVFAVNPDGAEYDLTGNPYREWRKNRQPNSGTTAVGTDINRNYGYRWGCCGGSSGSKSALTYRGSAAFSTPEARAVRDFMASRRVGGRQQIKVAITFHTAGEQVLWPYGYTYTDVPSDMTVEDHAALVVMGKKMASLNGYKPMQSSGLYVTDGDEIDYAYGAQRIWMYTFEMYPSHAKVSSDLRFYPADELIPRETNRNKEAIYYLIERAWCPYAVIGKSAQNCGPLFDDFETTTPWSRNPLGTDTASYGWERTIPALTTRQSNKVTSGARALVTRGPAGTTANTYDVDGITSIRGPQVQLPPTTGSLTFRYYFAHASNSSSADYFRAYVEREDGSRTIVRQEVGAANDDKPIWSSFSVSMAPWAGEKVRIVFEAADVAGASTVEAAVDDVRITRP